MYNMYNIVIKLNCQYLLKFIQFNKMKGDILKKKIKKEILGTQHIKDISINKLDMNSIVY